MSIRHTVADLRREYRQHQLDEASLHPDAIQQFERWFQEAVQAQVAEPNAMSLATVREGRPSARIVLLKNFDEQGFVFFTNYQSRKSRELDPGAWAALTFWWPELERQVRIEGRTQQVSAGESDTYFQSRDLGSRIGAWASPQSEPIGSRAELEQRVQEAAARFADQEYIPRPPHWGGYRVSPEWIEFWQGRPSRLHDRIAYTRQPDGAWLAGRLAP
jgi:pyridoxamine 5'-phosphate oxidase